VNRKSVYFVSTFDPNIQHPSHQLKKLETGFNNTRENDNQKLDIRISFRKSPSLKDLLMFRRSPHDVGVFKCKSGCILCDNHLYTGTFLTLKTGITVRATAIFDCMSRNLLYIIVCGGCKEFYVGETGDLLRNRFNVHRQQSQADAVIRPVAADQHLRRCGKNEYLVFPFFKPKYNSRIYRRIQEDKWIQFLQPKLNALQNT